MAKKVLSPIPGSYDISIIVDNYQLKDRDLNEMDHTFGLYDYDYHPKPGHDRERPQASR